MGRMFGSRTTRRGATLPLDRCARASLRRVVPAPSLSRGQGRETDSPPESVDARSWQPSETICNRLRRPIVVASVGEPFHGGHGYIVNFELRLRSVQRALNADQRIAGGD